MLFLFAVAAGQTPQDASLPVGSATVAESKGEVTLHSPKGDILESKRGVVLDPESVIDTVKGSVLLDLQDGSQVLVKSKSHVVLKAPNADRGYYLELLVGKIVAKVRKRLSNTPSFRMGTPTAVITVRGTRFEVEVTKEKRTFVEVYEGIVEVIGLHPGGRPVLLRPGYSTRVQRDRDPDEPRNWRDEGAGNDDRNGLGRTGGERDDRQPGAGSETSKPEAQSEREPHP
jgi:hypothetical protein